LIFYKSGELDSINFHTIVYLFLFFYQIKKLINLYYFYSKLLDIMPYIYLIHTRASLNINENVYKIGKTNDFTKRLSGYDKGSIPILILYVNNCDNFEKILLEIFNLTFIKRSDYGSEYFEGEPSKMIQIIMDKFYELNILLCYSNETVKEEKTQTIKNNSEEIFVKKRNLLQKLLNKINENNINKFDIDFSQVTHNLHNIETIQIRSNIQNAITNYKVNIMNSKQNSNIIVYKKFGDYLHNNTNNLFEITYNHLNSNNDEVKNFYNLFTNIV
jgi:hypothetical protein